MRDRSAPSPAHKAARAMMIAAAFAAGTFAAKAETDDAAEFSETLSGSYLAGRFARAENDTKEAADFYSNALVFDPASDMLYEQALLMEASQGSWDRAMRLAESLVKMEPGHRMAQMFIGLGAYRQGDWKAAEKSFRASASGPIGELTSSLASAWIMMAQKKPNDALDLLVVPRQAEWAQFYLRYHRALIADVAGRRNEAHQAYAKIFDQDARTLRTALAYTRSLANAGDIKGAKAVLKQHIEKSQSEGHTLARALMKELEQPNPKISLLVSDPSEGLAEVFYGLGESLIGEGAIGVGIVYLQMALYLEPQHPFALAALANAYEANRQYAEAIATYDRIPKGSPLEPAIEIRKAFNLNSLEKPDEARAALEQLLARDDAAAAAPVSGAEKVAAAFPAIELKGEVLRLGSAGENVRALQSALEQLGISEGNPADGRFGAQTRKSVQAFQQANGIKADGVVGQQTVDAILAKANASDAGIMPASTRAQSYLEPSEKLQALDALGNILRARKQYADAVEVYNRAIGMIAKPDRRHWVYYYARGTSYERLKNWPPAEADLKKALELYPDQPLVLNYLGYSWIDQGIQLDEGMRLIERAVAVKPDDGYIVDSLGWAHYKRGNYAEAVRYLERAVELRPDDPVLNDHLGDALWKVGREREAKFQWDQSLSLKPEPDDALKTRRKLEEGLVEKESSTPKVANGAAASDTDKRSTP
ncbi:MAG: tetratricopeptide repeat protein [Hyphomicrobium sp.]|nr:tetratricopeptide repeat protein [Hyphomicrobium sp.]